MRFYGLALFASAAVLGACGGGENKGTTTDSAATAAPTPAATTPAPGGTAAAAPITGTTHEVKMVGDDKGYRYEPANITIKRGDAVRWTNVSGGPHNVSFWPDSIPSGAQGPLSANMPQQISELSSPMMMNPNESYTISFGGVPAGQYPYHCTPHLAMNMKGVITVQ